MPNFRPVARGVCLAAFAVLLCAVSAAAGETIIHTGDAGQLRPPSNWMVNLGWGQDPILAPSDSSLSGNRVEVRSTGATSPDDVFGALSESGNVSGNSASVSGGWVDSNVYGGYSDSGAAYNNSAFVSGGMVGRSVNGGYSDSGAAYNNSAFVSGGTVGSSVFGGNSSSGAAYNNSVSVSGGTVGGIVYGGHSRFGAVYNNSASVSGGTVGVVLGGFSAYGAAYNNSAFFSGGTVDGDVYGGVSYSGAAYDNSVSVSGGTVNGHVFGGSIRTGNGAATGNTVTIGGSAAFSAASIIVGGGDDLKIVNNDPGQARGDLVSGNTLNIVNWSGTVGTIGNFATINFVVPAAASAVTPALALAGGAADFSNMDANLNPDTALNNPNNVLTTISVGSIMGGGTAPGVGEQIILVDKVVNADHLDGGAFSTRKGALLDYDFVSRVAGGALVLEARSYSFTPGSKVVTQSYLAPVSLLNRGGDHVAAQGVAALDAAFGTDLPSGWTRPAFFGSVGGGHDRSKTGSHVSMDSATFLAGLGVKNATAFGSLAFGAFFETGYGDYDTTSDIAGRASVHGDGDASYLGGGDASYLGGGLLARLNLQNGLYAEASARVGRAKNDLDGTDLMDGMGRAATYDTSDTYYGAHAGLGYLWNLGRCSSLDVYGKYFWTHAGSESFALATDDPVRLDSVNSHRLRAGARYSLAVNEYVSPYVGGAFEYELAGKSKGTAYNMFRLPESRLRGGTGIGELGLSARLGRATADLGVQGYVGRRRGVNGVVRVGVAF